MRRLVTMCLAIALSGCYQEHDVSLTVEPAEPCPGRSSTVHLYPWASKSDLHLPGADLAEGTVEARLRNLTQAGSQTQVYHGSNKLPFTITIDQTARPHDQYELALTTTYNDGKQNRVTRNFSAGACN